MSLPVADTVWNHNPSELPLPIYPPSSYHGKDVLGLEGSSVENVPAQDYQQEEEAQEHMAEVTENVVEGTKGRREKPRESQAIKEIQRMNTRISSIPCFPLLTFS